MKCNLQKFREIKNHSGIYLASYNKIESIFDQKIRGIAAWALIFFPEYTVWKSVIKRDYDFYGKINIFFREINYSTKGVTKELISRNFQINERDMYICGLNCGNYGNLPSHVFDKNFVKATFLLKKLLKS